MVNQRLLDNELEFYKKQKISMKTIKYTKDLFPKLFEKYNYYGMTEDSYCCRGLEHCCWQELVEEGVWDYTLEEVKSNILRNIKNAKKYLYNGRKYGGNRLYICDNKDGCYVYIYLRDIIKEDYQIWFSKDENLEFEDKE